jgi:hypothetical protein
MGMTNHFHISRSDVKGGGNMLARNQQQMVRRLGIEVMKNDDLRVLINDPGGDFPFGYFTKETAG